MTGTSGLHWRSVAQEWKYFGPPLRPCDEDIHYMEKVVAERFAGTGELNVQLCGVTPEIAMMQWPSHTQLMAVEQSQEMIREVWPGDLHGARTATHGDWLDIGSNQNKFDMVIGDGCFISLNYPDGYHALAKTISEKLKDEGLLLMRFFTQPEEKEASDDVFSDLMAGKIGSFHAFKWRLAMSLQQSSRQGIRLHDIYRAWNEAEIDKKLILSSTGWPREAIETIDLYENKLNSFAFATLSEVYETLSDYFVRESVYFPEYELGERCPIIAFRPR